MHICNFKKHLKTHKNNFYEKKRTLILIISVLGFGGELGIRTLEAFRLTAFRVLHLRPLGQLSNEIVL